MGNSLPKPAVFIQQLMWWLCARLDPKFTFSGRKLTTGSQLDGDSCGFFAMNAIWNGIFDTGILVHQGVRLDRIQWFNRLCDATNLQVFASAPLVGSLFDLRKQEDDSRDSDAADDDLDCAGGFSDDGFSEHEGYRDSNDDITSDEFLPLEIPTKPPNLPHQVSTAPSQKTLHDFFRTPRTPIPNPTPDTTRPGSVTPVLQKRKRMPEEEVIAPTSKKRDLSGVSKTAQHEAKSRAAADTGTFDVKQMARFQAKVRELDPHAEFFIDGNPRKVRHSKCGRSYAQKAANNTSNFRAHVQACKGPTKNRLHIANVDRSSFKNFTMSSPLAGSSGVVPVTSTVENTTLPCPGLTPEFDSGIFTYLARTQTMGGGARPRNVIAEALFNTKWVALRKRQRKKVLRTEATEFRWINWREQGFITSTTCLKGSPSSQEPAQPCSNCQALFKVKIFRNALRRPLPEQGNLKFIPYTYRANVAGGQLAKTIGVYEIIEKAVNVSLLCYLRYCGGTQT
jgi:hypothetical protein